MAVPNHTTIATQLFSRLKTQLVDAGYASKVRRATMANGELPSPTDKPAIVYTVNAEYEHTDFGDQAVVAITIYVIRHMESGITQSDTCVEKVSEALNRWTPSITGIGTNPLRRLASGDGQYDTDHIAEVMSFGAYLSEDS